MRRERYQTGSLTKKGGRWIAQWWEDGRHRKRTLGRVEEMGPVKAKTVLAAIIAPLNERGATSSFGAFVNEVYLPISSVPALVE